MPVCIEGLREALQTQVVVPRHRKSFMLFVKHLETDVVTADDVAALLLDANISDSIVEGNQLRSVFDGQLETHIRVTMRSPFCSPWWATEITGSLWGQVRRRLR